MLKKKTLYENIPEWGKVDDLVQISQDFLPKPEELVFRPKLRKVTLTLDEDSIIFFKQKADELNTSYQRMIRILLQEYSKRMRCYQ
ncbi:MAG: CopG family transcriptional regulator [Candidatus Pacebacteria bacterium CG_4_10_14_0_8_um_filter_43_12]|nr:MAG: CopG family transcriptional regulator [Candidatus Pacebacteria bacterium CG10_big_fil_rev_8_21_14_0_10_44_11]PIY79171.1 MAG: CopG family transcriptional regulator [Candidatus Pacebacteria bacterium CG_4_10_14_0_8_um_filter_43_12]